MTDFEAQKQIEAMLSDCRDIDADVRYHPQHRRMTIMVWEDGTAADEQRALSIQQQIQQRSAQYPRLVCYCFDPFSTLVYAV